jgi:hypothetical protein
MADEISDGVGNEELEAMGEARDTLTIEQVAELYGGTATETTEEAEALTIADVKAIFEAGE